MPDDNQQQDSNQQQNDTQQQPAAGSKYNPSTLEDAQRIIEALTKRVAERDASIDEMKRTSTSLSQRLNDIENATKKRLEEEGNWAELARQRAAELEALKPYQERAQALESVIRASNEERVARVPEDMRALIPTDYPPEKLQAWLNANERRLSKAPAPQYDAGVGAAGGTGAAGGVKVTDEDRVAAEIARSQGFDIKAEDIAKRRLNKDTP